MSLPSDRTCLIRGCATGLHDPPKPFSRFSTPSVAWWVCLSPPVKSSALSKTIQRHKLSA